MLKIILKNGETVRLDWNMLVLQLVEEELGSIDKLTEEFLDNNQMKTFNVFTYALLQANLDEELTFKQAVRLVKFEDMEIIGQFVSDEIEKSNKVAEAKKNFTRAAAKKNT